MFTRVYAALTAVLLMMGSAQGATDDHAPSKDEVIAQVTKAVEFYKAAGRQRALAVLSTKNGPFSKGMDYVDVHDLSGVCVAHPLSPDIIGVNRLEIVDIRGKRFIHEMVAAARSRTSGWVSYMRENPNTGKIEHKIAYWQLHDGLLFKAGTSE